MNEAKSTERIKTDEQYTTHQAASILGVSDAQFRKLVKDKDVKPSGHYVNPNYKSGPMCPLWRGLDVRRLKRTAQCKRMKSVDRTKRYSAAIKAVQTRIDNAIDEVQQMEIVIPELPISDLRLRARSRQDRDVVNYIRHELTDYEVMLSQLYGQVGKSEIYKQIKNKILDEIAFVYPELAEECRNQKIYGGKDL